MKNFKNKAWILPKVAFLVTVCITTNYTFVVCPCLQTPGSCKIKRKKAVAQAFSHTNPLNTETNVKLN